jgi:hypothetical protein
MTERQGVAVEITDLIYGEIKQYASLILASVALGVSGTAVKRAGQLGRTIKNTYFVNV